MGPEDLFLGDIVHEDGNAQHRRQRDQVRPDMPIGNGTMVRAPVAHHGIDITEWSGTRGYGHKPGRWPGGIRAFVEDSMYILRYFDAISLRDLQYRAESLDEIDAEHGHGHAADGLKLG